MKHCFVFCLGRSVRNVPTVHSPEGSLITSASTKPLQPAQLLQMKRKKINVTRRNADTTDGTLTYTLNADNALTPSHQIRMVKKEFVSLPSTSSNNNASTFAIMPNKQFNSVVTNVTTIPKGAPKYCQTVVPSITNSAKKTSLSNKFGAGTINKKIPMQQITVKRPWPERNASTTASAFIPQLSDGSVDNNNTTTTSIDTITTTTGVKRHRANLGKLKDDDDYPVFKVVRTETLPVTINGQVVVKEEPRLHAEPSTSRMQPPSSEIVPAK